MRNDLFIHLTIEELKAITGRVKASAQMRWLRQQGFTVLLRADGKPLVSRAHFESMMNGNIYKAKDTVIEPDYSSLK